MNFNRMMRAEVVDREDPDELGRVRIKLPTDGTISDDRLPWAIPISTFGNMGGSEDSGSFSVPKEGTKVWVFFEGGDRHKPVYLGGVVAGNTIPKRFLGEADESKEQMDENAGEEEPESEIGEYGLSHGFVLPGGSVFEISEEGRLVIYTTAGYRLEVQKDGTKIEHIENDSIQYVVGDVSKVVEGSHEVEASGMRLESNEIRIGDLFNELVQVLLEHTHPTGVGPSGTPINSADFQTVDADMEAWKS